MSVRAIAIRNGPRPLVPAEPIHAVRPAGSRSRERRRSSPSPVRRLWLRWADDRQLIGVKILLLGLLALVTMILEVAQ